MKINAIILAAGQGSRMKSNKPKVLFEVLDKPMIKCVYDNLIQAGVENIIPIINPERKNVLDVLPDNVDFAFQKETLGTGHAVMQAKSLLENSDGLTIIVAGDQPLINSDEIKNMIDYHISNSCDMTLMTSILEEATGYGRVIKKGFQVQKIVEQKDLSEQDYGVKEVNISTYCFSNKLLFKHIEEITNSNNQHEYYVTDLVEIFNKNKLKVGSIPITDNHFSIGVNDIESLTVANKIMRQFINKKHMENGVEIIDPDNTYIGYDVEISSDTIIYPGSYIMGSTKIGSGCKIMSSYIYDSKIGNEVAVGPYAHIRNKSIIGDNCRIGNFVEIKNSTLDIGVKSAHLTYLGDAQIGEHVNIGCGVITANYDGSNKHKTVIGSNSFIGSNVSLIAPINIGKKVVVAAGSTISVNEVEDNALIIARSREVIKSNYRK